MSMNDRVEQEILARLDRIDLSGSKSAGFRQDRIDTWEARLGDGQGRIIGLDHGGVNPVHEPIHLDAGLWEIRLSQSRLALADKSGVRPDWARCNHCAWSEPYTDGQTSRLRCRYNQPQVPCLLPLPGEDLLYAHWNNVHESDWCAAWDMCPTPIGQQAEAWFVLGTDLDIAGWWRADGSIAGGPPGEPVNTNTPRLVFVDAGQTRFRAFIPIGHTLCVALRARAGEAR
jgi:hypothetical protein